MNDLQPFVHGSEGTHACCDSRLKARDEDEDAVCCYCHPHTGCELTCPILESWIEEFCTLYESIDGDDGRKAKIFLVPFIVNLLARKEAEVLQRVEREVIGEDLVVTDLDKKLLPLACEVIDVQNEFRASQRIKLAAMREKV